jgi:hypothetical protein
MRDDLGIYINYNLRVPPSPRLRVSRNHPIIQQRHLFLSRHTANF